MASEDEVKGLVHSSTLKDGREIRTVSLPVLVSACGILVAALCAALTWGWAQTQVPLTYAQKLGEEAGKAAGEAAAKAFHDRIDAELRRADEVHARMMDRIDNHETRIGELERWRLVHVESGGHGQRR